MKCDCDVKSFVEMSYGTYSTDVNVAVVCSNVRVPFFFILGIRMKRKRLKNK